MIQAHMADSTSLDSTALRHNNSLRFVLVVLVALVLVLLSLENSFVSMEDEVEKPQNFSLIFAAVVETSLSMTSGHADRFYPDEIFSIDWSQHIKKSDILHQAALHRACLRHPTSIIPWTYGRSEKSETWNLMQLVNETDPQRHKILGQCPVVDIFVPKGLRDFGYCEDAAAYTKFLEARMLPEWALDPKNSGNGSYYYESCPNTPVIFFNHYSDGLLDLPDWPASKPVYMMPNIEMYELESEHYWRADVILCKTALCAKYVNKWYEQEGNPRGTKVLYSRHTTSNVALVTKSQLAEARPDKNFSNVSFVYTVGNSASKGTQQVLGCWLSQPNLPRLDMYITQKYYDDAYKEEYGKSISKSSNVFVHTGQLQTAAFGQLVTDAAYFLCPSQHEGYGHYINQARSSRALIVTTDVSPMNELITSTSGALIKAVKTPLKTQFLSGVSDKKYALRGVEGYFAEFFYFDLCKTIMILLNTSVKERIERADKALQQYYFDTVFFAHKMQELRVIARSHRHHIRIDMKGQMVD